MRLLALSMVVGVTASCLLSAACSPVPSGLEYRRSGSSNDDSDEDEDDGTTKKAPVASAADAPIEGQGESGGCAYVRVESQEEAGGSEQGFAAAPSSAARLLYLNRRGGTYSPGYNNSSANRSSIVRGTVTLPPYSRSDSEWQRVVQLVKEEFAPYNIAITEEDPGATAHIEMVVSGHPSMIGAPGFAAGIAPFDCGRITDRAIGFAFDRMLQGVEDQARVIIHEAGHTLGLDHSYHCPDVMTYLFNCSVRKRFVNQSVTCGESAPRGCQCGGSQNSADHLMRVLGPRNGSTDNGIPPGGGGGGGGGGALTVALASPEDGGTVPTNQPLTVSATISGGTASKVYLDWEMPLGIARVDCDAPQTGTTCNRNENSVSFTFVAGSGTRAWSVRAVDSSGRESRSQRRTVTLGSAGQNSTVSVSSPRAQASFSPGNTVQLRASVANADAVWLTWTAPSGATNFQLSNLGGTSWGLDIPISPSATKGSRTLTINGYSQRRLVGSSNVTIQVQ